MHILVYNYLIALYLYYISYVIIAFFKPICKSKSEIDSDI